jgi:hypothetical protein
LIELVEYVKVYEGGDVAVRFKYRDEYLQFMECIEVNTDTLRKAG